MLRFVNWSRASSSGLRAIKCVTASNAGTAKFEQRSLMASSQRSPTRWPGTILRVVSLAVAAYVLLLFLTGGFSFELWGMRISSRNSKRPFFAYALVMALYTWRVGAARLGSELAPLETFARRAFGVVPVLLSVAVTVVGVVYNTYTAAGADAYGYVSQADLWLTRDLFVPVPLATVLPWPNADWSVSPLGYRPATMPGYIVPTYAPGLPLLMAVASLVSRPAMFWVVPLTGGLLVWCTALIGRALGGRSVAAISAALVSTSPVVIYHLVVPMSDVPAAAFWTASAMLAIRGGPYAWVAAGVAASLATLVRPNTVVLAVGPIASAAWAAWTRRTNPAEATIRAAAYLTGLLPGVCIVALINRELYGSPFLSGYGPLSELYSLDYGAMNLSRFASWIIETETPLVCTALLAPFVLWRRNPRGVLLLTLMGATVVAVYMFYLPFETWTFLRFLLPAIPTLLVFTAVGMKWTWGVLPPRLRFPLVAVTLAAAFVWRMDDARGAFGMRESERRYADVGHYVAANFGPQAVFLTMQHSGTIRYYGGRMTVRWDSIDPDWLDRAPAILRNVGYDPYILVEAGEAVEMRERLGTRTRLGALDWKPIVVLNGSNKVMIYDPDDAPSR